MDSHSPDKPIQLHIRQGAKLPHWTRENAVYAVTFRLGDSLPSTVLSTLQRERENILATAQQMGRVLSKDETKRMDYLHSENIEAYLDAGHGACWLRDSRIAPLVAGALQHFDGQRYELFAWCVMPNHVHVIFHPKPDHTLTDLLHSWKSYTASQANRVLQRKGKFWMDEYYDHLIRDEQEFAHNVKYVLNNPIKAKLKDWPWVWASPALCNQHTAEV